VVDFALDAATRIGTGIGKSRSATSWVTYSPATRALNMTLEKTQKLSIETFEMSGRKIPALSSEKVLVAGVHSLRLGARQNKMFIIRVRKDGSQVSIRLNPVR
jgi:hypothetical protein